jgi:hypothetical protein
VAWFYESSLTAKLPTLHVRGWARRTEMAQRRGLRLTGARERWRGGGCGMHDRWLRFWVLLLLATLAFLLTIASFMHSVLQVVWP